MDYVIDGVTINTRTLGDLAETQRLLGRHLTKEETLIACVLDNTHPHLGYRNCFRIRVPKGSEWERIYLAAAVNLGCHRELLEEEDGLTYIHINYGVTPAEFADSLFKETYRLANDGNDDVTPVHHYPEPGPNGRIRLPGEINCEFE